MHSAANYHALQPVVNTDSGQIIYHEMLIRFGDGRHVQRAIEDAEAKRTVHEIDLWILSRGIEVLRADRNARVAVNLSPMTVEEHIDDVIAMVSAAGGDASRLVIELTETAPIFDNVKMLSFARTMDVLGVRLAVDDFGSGYCDAGRAVLVRATFIKVPKHGRNGWASMLPWEIDALRRLATSNSGHLIAEGIETVEELNAVIERGFVGAQGFLFLSMEPGEALARAGRFVGAERGALATPVARAA